MATCVVVTYRPNHETGPCGRTATGRLLTGGAACPAHLAAERRRRDRDNEAEQAQELLAAMLTAAPFLHPTVVTSERVEVDGWALIRFLRS